MFQAAFNNLTPCSDVNNTLIKLGDTVLNNIKFGLKRNINVLAFLVAAKVGEDKRNKFINVNKNASEELLQVKKPVVQEIIILNDQWEKTEW